MIAENAEFVVYWYDDVWLFFSGIELITAEYHNEENQIIHLPCNTDWFYDNQGIQHEILVEKVLAQPLDEDPTSYAKIRVDGELLKTLEIFETFHGDYYVELQDPDEEFQYT